MERWLYSDIIFICLLFLRSDRSWSSVRLFVEQIYASQLTIYEELKKDIRKAIAEIASGLFHYVMDVFIVKSFKGENLEDIVFQTKL